MPRFELDLKTKPEESYTKYEQTSDEQTNIELGYTSSDFETFVELIVKLSFENIN